MKNFEEKAVKDLNSVVGGKTEGIEISSSYDMDDKIIGIDIKITPRK